MPALVKGGDEGPRYKYIKQRVNLDTIYQPFEAQELESQEVSIDSDHSTSRRYTLEEPAGYIEVNVHTVGNGGFVCGKIDLDPFVKRLSFPLKDVQDASISLTGGDIFKYNADEDVDGGYWAIRDTWKKDRPIAYFSVDVDELEKRKLQQTAEAAVSTLEEAYDRALRAAEDRLDTARQVLEDAEERHAQ